jgi:hypothetical protein
MKKLNLLLFLWALGLAALASAPAAVAKMLPDADTNEVRAYKLTDAGFAKYIAATHKLRDVKFENCIAGDDDDDDEPTSIASAAAKIDAVPAARAALQSAGMTSHEYVVLAFSLLENGMASYMMQTPGGKLPAGINPANVDFVRKHSAELHTLANESDEEACEHDDND